ncbi:F-box protein At3g61340-like [Arachis stenosperma]|uniref:F-box protein At3g61340-like n=1 Tax=Arachis stenosperma TaxID=217475 RepID=UPI0025AC27C9|nr:F-box protein At3g61340-like [Arachis stenosperma]
MEKKHKGMNDVLPLDLIWRIFMRLPAKELFRFRCVSKLWRTLKSDRDFAESHLNHYSVAPSHSCLFVNYFLSVGHIVDLDTLAFKELSLPFSRKKRSFDFRVMGSCRGPRRNRLTSSVYTENLLSFPDDIKDKDKKKKTGHRVRQECFKQLDVGKDYNRNGVK